MAISHVIYLENEHKATCKRKNISFEIISEQCYIINGNKIDGLKMLCQYMADLEYKKGKK
jgi:hypothetical protein